MSLNSAKLNIELSLATIFLLVLTIFALGAGVGFWLFQHDDYVHDIVRATGNTALPATQQNSLQHKNLNQSKQPYTISQQSNTTENNIIITPKANTSRQPTIIDLAELKVMYPFNSSRTSTQKIRLQYLKQQGEYSVGERIFNSHWAIERASIDSTYITDGLNTIRIHISEPPLLIGRIDENIKLYKIEKEYIQKSETDILEEKEFAEIDAELADLEFITEAEEEDSTTDATASDTGVNEDSSLSIYLEDIEDEY